MAVNNPTASNQSAETGAAQSQSGFDTLILGDLLFNHSEHAKLIDSIRMSMKCSPESVALVFFTPYRPWLLQRDLAFFELAREAGFDVHKVFEIVMDKVMFEQDPGVSAVAINENLPY